jgi:hypothetical protein
MLERPILLVTRSIRATPTRTADATPSVAQMRLVPVAQMLPKYLKLAFSERVDDRKEAIPVPASQDRSIDRPT